jgi:sulfhydrogenase subunit alpha
MHVQIVDGQVVEVRLSIYEPPRFFEGFLRGRAHTEPPDITARICGICPVAYQMSACTAIEDACGVAVPRELGRLRRLLYCGEWIESHALHVHLLHAPDFLGVDSVTDMVARHRHEVERGLAIKKIGNDLVELLGGRAVHPINVKVGGFYRVPTRREVASLRDRLDHGRELAADTVRWVASLPRPHLDSPHELVALDDPEGYPFFGTRIVSTEGLDIAVDELPAHVVETHVAHSTAKHAHLLERGRYQVGPLARFALNFDKLSPAAAAAAREVGLEPHERNQFTSIVVRAVEVLHAFDTAVALVDGYVEPAEPSVDVPPRAAVGHGATEAPRGLLYHRYALEGDGSIAEADIVPPTSQNQPAIEHDLWRFVEDNLELADDELAWQSEMAIRNYDPCISCAAHFLDLTVDRRGSDG